MIEYFNFGFNLLAAVCLAFTLFYLIRYKVKEDERLWKGLNAFIVSMIFLEIYLLIKVFVLFVEMFNWNLANLMYNLNLVCNIGLTPLIAICMLIGALLFKEV